MLLAIRITTLFQTKTMFIQKNLPPHVLPLSIIKSGIQKPQKPKFMYVASDSHHETDIDQ
jgi:hypothetical protein